MRKRSGNNCPYVDIMSASPEVTGSCTFCTVKYPNNEFEHFIVDCGLFQELMYSELNSELQFDPKDIDFVLVTHNHVDHIGRLPLLVKKGFSGSIYTTEDTKTFMPVALDDTASILNQTAKKKMEAPLYSKADADRVCDLTQGVDYEKTISLSKNIDVTFFKNGHLVGASFILVTIHYYGCDDINILFTGDYNNYNPFFAVPKLPKWVNKLPLNIVCESTYGLMESSEILHTFEDNIEEFFKEKPKGTVIIPAFALGRSQEVLKRLKHMQELGKLSGIPIYLDGNLTHRYTRLFTEKLLSSVDSNKYAFLPDNLYMASRDIRGDLMETTGSKIIVSSSGMGSYGPAHAYIQNYIECEDALIHFTGYCVEGTVSRQLYDAREDEEVTFGGSTYVKKASVKFTNEFSAHAKADELIDLLSQFKDIKIVLVTHGSVDAKEEFSRRVAEEVDVDNVGTLTREYLFRLGTHGFIKAMNTKF